MSKQPKRFLRRKHLAERYSITERTVERMVKDGRLPPPDLYNGPFPLWDETSVEKAERTTLRAGGRTP
jgi:hypothetical protein